MTTLTMSLMHARHGLTISSLRSTVAEAQHFSRSYCRYNSTAHRLVAVPNGAWDTHIHLFEPDRWPYAPKRRYTPAPASLDQYPTSVTGCTSLVIVHASMQGSSPAPLVDILKRHAGKPECKLRGLATLDFDALSDDDLDALHHAGVRGTRFHLMTGTAANTPADIIKRIDAIAPRVARLGWVIDIFCPLASWAGLTGYILKLDNRIKIVADHFGSAYPGDENKPEFQALLHLISERVFVKLAAFERLYDGHPEGVESLTGVAEAIVKAGPDRILYASDWPHTQFSRYRAGKTTAQILTDVEPFRDVSNGAHIEKLRQWIKDDHVWTNMLVNNPKRVFD